MSHDIILNEYIEKFSEIKPLLDKIGENINIGTINVINHGCKKTLVSRIVKYLKNFDLTVLQYEYKENI